ncbi:hypothetical protein EDD40_6657 [Saccharothrix texasensis]|uniref:Uncharacterized protein n=1 Tax=Saccharothrix texasensis TaxID=103734 RepID=A0A3N1HFE6_9PSEU|nr:hypothetical protein EDD40_6657 [Saccharothrix texasensis]
MGATAALSATGLAVASGEDVTRTGVVRNAGDLVEEFAVDVVVRFAPPRAAEVGAGRVPPGVRVRSGPRATRTPPRAPGCAAGTGW